MKPRLLIFRYLLVAAAWILLFASLRLPGGDLNGFLGWNGRRQTKYILQWLFNEPSQFIADIRHGDSASWTDAVWMLIMLLGLILLAAAPILIHRARSRTARRAVRTLATALLFLPLTLCLPPSYRFPIPGPGLWLLAVAHFLAFLALILPDRRSDPDHAFPVSIKPS